MPTVEPQTTDKSPDLAAESSRKVYHTPEFREYGTVADLTRTGAVSSQKQDTVEGYANPTS